MSKTDEYEFLKRERETALTFRLHYLQTIRDLLSNKDPKMFPTYKYDFEMMGNEVQKVITTLKQIIENENKEKTV